MFGSGKVHFNGKKNENYKSLGAGAPEDKKIFFCPTLTLIFPLFGQREKISYIYLKRLVLIHLKNYDKNI